MTEGAFNDRGSFRKERPKNLAGIDGFIASLILQRRANPNLEPWEFARQIGASPYRHAFPNACDSFTGNSSRWTSTLLSNPIPWCAVGVGTSAESAVKYACWSQCLMPYDPATTLQALLASISTPIKEKRRRIAEMEAPIVAAFSAAHIAAVPPHASPPDDDTTSPPSNTRTTP